MRARASWRGRRADLHRHRIGMRPCRRRAHSALESGYALLTHGDRQTAESTPRADNTVKAGGRFVRLQMPLHDGTAQRGTECLHLETTRCGMVRGRRLPLIIDAAV
jgi:hypothetical protein